MTLAAHLLSEDAAVLANLLPETWLKTVPAACQDALAPGRHGQLDTWDDLLSNLPPLSASDRELAAPVIRIGRAEDANHLTRSTLHKLLANLHPWRKGPFELFGIHIDAEWRSDMKFARLGEVDCTNARVLDVGCGNGYYALRLLGAGAASVVGVDPGLGHLVQFAALRHYAPDLPVQVLPLPFEALPASPSFDLVCSLGVIYHQRDPLDHLKGLLRMLTPGGTLVVESLVVTDDADRMACSPDRYARMRNVWFLPSTALLMRWLMNLGLSDVRLLHEGPTTPSEQRSTDWMRFESLAEALDPNDPELTVEGYPAPWRAMVAGDLKQTA